MTQTPDGGSYSLASTFDFESLHHHTSRRESFTVLDAIQEEPLEPLTITASQLEALKSTRRKYAKLVQLVSHVLEEQVHLKY